MLIFTNRVVNMAGDESAFGRSFEPAGTHLGFASVSGLAQGGAWTVSNANNDASDVDALNALLPLFSGARKVLVYLHGNNNTPAACFERCAKLEALYGFETIGFSWASEGFLSDGSELPGVEGGNAGDETDLAKVKASNRTEGAIQRKIRRYRQAKTNAQESVDALARFLRLLGTARLHANIQPFTLAAHSLGAHFLQYTLDVPGAGESMGTAHNVALVAACVRAAGHRDWLDKMRPKGQVFVTYNKGDSVLFGAYIADGSQFKLGTDPGPELLQSRAVRYVSFSNASVGFGGHGYFVLDKMPKKALRLFTRIFGSQRDIEIDEYPRQVYPVGCDEDGLTCYMAKPTAIDSG
ncbi:alpha/beta hydrolase [Rhizobacter sp. P5_C2]